MFTISKKIPEWIPTQTLETRYNRKQTLISDYLNLYLFDIQITTPTAVKFTLIWVEM